MDISRDAIDSILPRTFFTLPIGALNRLAFPLLLIDAEANLLWQNAAAKVACPAHLLREIFTVPLAVERLQDAMAGGILPSFEDERERIRLQGEQRIEGKYLLCSVEDLRIRERKDEEYRRLQKSGSLFLFSQGLGHDLKDRLTGVVGNLNLARVLIEDGRQGEETLEYIRDAERAALDADGLVQQFMLFSHNDSETSQGLDLSALISNAAALTLGGSNRKLQISQHEAIWKLKGNPGQIQQALQNILQNSAEAMSGSGIIHVDLENLRILADNDGPGCDETKIRDGQFGPGDYVVVHIRDSGEGILGRDLPYIFEPFFSRKELRQGLGLTVALSIVRKHGGFIDIHSQSGRGTTVSIYLPVAAVGETPIHAEWVKRPAKILVMDDESLVREVWERMLMRLGHRGSFVAEGAEAIYLFQTALKSDHPFDMVILDLTVPDGMGAQETLKRLKDLDPEVKAVICSGYTQDPLMQSYQECGFKAALAKPFGLENLSRLVQDVLA